MSQYSEAESFNNGVKIDILLENSELKDSLIAHLQKRVSCLEKIIYKNFPKHQSEIDAVWEEIESEKK
jgi:hypothetical protein